MSHAVPLALETSRTRPSMGQIKVSRAVLLCLIALVTTAIWGVILHFGARALGFPIGATWLAAALVVIFLLLLLSLSLAALMSDTASNDKSDPAPRA